MKKAVDLTENRQFSAEHINAFSFLGLKFPWQFVEEVVECRDTDLEALEELFLTGSSTERDRKRYVEQLYSSSYCDRCGKPLQNEAWRKTYCLCSKCYSEVEEQCNKHWRIDKSTKELVNESTDRLVIELNYM